MPENEIAARNPPKTAMKKTETKRKFTKVPAGAYFLKYIFLKINI